VRESESHSTAADNDVPGLSCLAVIPARGGSKRIPKKNVRVFEGRPLIARTIEAAVGCGLFRQVIVSTDSREIAQVAQDLGAEVPFLRDPHLADDLVPVSAATVDALQRLDPRGAVFEHICQLMPNCPLRTARDIADSYGQFTHTGAEAQLSVVRYGWQNPWWAMRRDDAFALSALFEEAMTTRSQDLPELYCPTGAVWWAKADTLRREGTYHVRGKTGWEIPWIRGMDIDTEDDWAMAELLARMVENRSSAEAR
jgi:pseudaminic acid cytidylyltransferase